MCPLLSIYSIKNVVFLSGQGYTRSFFSSRPQHGILETETSRSNRFVRASSRDTKGGSEPPTRSPRPEFMALSMISSNEVCGENEIAPRPKQDPLEISQADDGQDRREKSFFSGILESSKNKI